MIGHDESFHAHDAGVLEIARGILQPVGLRLAVIVGEGEHVAARERRTEIARAARAFEVRMLVHDVERRVCLRHRPRRRTLIDQDDLEVGAGLARQAVEELWQMRLTLVGRNDDAERRSRLTRGSLPRQQPPKVRRETLPRIAFARQSSSIRAQTACVLGVGEHRSYRPGEVACRADVQGRFAQLDAPGPRRRRDHRQPGRHEIEHLDVGAGPGEHRIDRDIRCAEVIAPGGVVQDAGDAHVGDPSPGE